MSTVPSSSLGGVKPFLEAQHRMKAMARKQGVERAMLRKQILGAQRDRVADDAAVARLLDAQGVKAVRLDEDTALRVKKVPMYARHKPGVLTEEADDMARELRARLVAAAAATSNDAPESATEETIAGDTHEAGE
jgi:hypothetical protein